MGWSARRFALSLRTLAIAFALTVLASTGAEAIATLDVVFTERNGAAITPTAVVEAAPGDQLTASLMLGAGAEGISSYAVSIVFDEVPDNELDLVSAQELLPAGFDFNLTPGVATQESTGSQRGEVLTFDAATLGFGPASTSFQVGLVQFLVTGNVATDGDDILSGLFGVADGIFDNLGGSLGPTAAFGSAAVNVPEPTTGLLLGLGLLGLRCVAPRDRARA